MKNNSNRNVQGTMATLGATIHAINIRPENDYYATPENAVTPLIQMETFNKKRLWEPACGGKHISNVFEKQGYIVRSSDLVNRCENEVFDFLSNENYTWDGDIITNPPYSLATEFLEKALSIVQDGAKIAFLLRIQFLEGVKRREIFNKYPPIRIWVSTRNIRCARNGDFKNATGNACTYCWFVWEKGFVGEPSIKWFN